MALEFYKKGQGYYTRLGTALGLGILAVFGCYSLYSKLGGLTAEESLGPQIGQWVQAGVPAVLLAVLGWLIFYVVNKPSYADFMIATEGEMKKVSWSTKKEIYASTMVVIVTVILMAIILWLIDMSFTALFGKIGIIILPGK